MNEPLLSPQGQESLFSLLDNSLIFAQDWISKLANDTTGDGGELLADLVRRIGLSDGKLQRKRVTHFPFLFSIANPGRTYGSSVIPRKFNSDRF